MGSVKLVFKGKDSFEKDDAKRFITLASRRLIDVFRNDNTNTLLLLIFTSSETFKPLETEAVWRNVDNSLLFTEMFCALLENRDDVVRALNQLLNLNDRNLAEYEKKIRDIFKTILPSELLVVDVPDLTDLPDMRDVPDLKDVPDYFS